MLNDDSAVSNLIALSMAGIIFLGLFGIMVLQTLDQTNVMVPGNHEELASQLYGENVYAPGGSCVAQFDGCLLQLGLRTNAGVYNTSVYDGVIAGLSGDQADNLSEGELRALLDQGWFRIMPHDIDRNKEILVIEDPNDCNPGSYPSPWPLYDSNDVDCENDNPGSLSIPVGTEIIVVHGTRNQYDAADVEAWHQGAPNRLLVLANADATSIAHLQSYFDQAADSHLGGLHDPAWPDSSSFLAGGSGDVPNLGASFEHQGPTAASRTGAFGGPIIVTTLDLAAPGFQNILARSEPGFLEVGSRDDFDSAKRLLSDGSSVFLMEAWSAPSTH